MKKPMKFKRYEGGGEISGEVDPKEAAAKEAGLKASKGDDVGFFQRLRMGNIDDPSSEAYKRFGAGASQLTPRKVSIGAEDDAAIDDKLRRRAMERSRLMQQDISAGTDFVNRPQDEGYRPYISPRDRAIAEGEKDADKIIENTGPRTQPVIKTPAAKQDKQDKPAKPAKPPEAKVTDTGDESARLLNKYKKPPLRQETMDERAKRFIEKREAAKREKEANPARGRGGVPYQKGGMVSSASKRADGIATKGKTRGKIC